MTKTEKKDGFVLVALANDQVRVKLMDLGATIVSLCVRDRNDRWQDVVLGYESLSDYETYKGYLGAIVGRTANRIRAGRFTLEGETYQLPVNNGPNCNHGGLKGFSFRKFEAAALTENSVTFTLHSPDGEEGYPGNMDVKVTYRLQGSELTIEYEVTSDAATLASLTSHAYFNLSGHAVSVKDHLLQIDADSYGHVDGDGLFTGEKEAVQGTPFDFRRPRKIAEALDSHHGQIRTATGLDHPYFLNQGTDAMRLYSPETGISMTVSTSYPVCQVYSANYLGGERGKDRLPMDRQTGICLEASFAPDDINIEKEQSKTIVRKGEIWTNRVSFRFDAEHEGE